MFTRLSPEVEVTAAGVRVPRMARATLDVVVEGHRVWSFDPRRDSRPTAGDRRGRGRWVPWPRRLVPFLVGSAHVRVVPHLGGEPLLDASVRFTDDARTVDVRDERGHRLSVDKGGRLQRTFDRTDDGLRDLIVERTDLVLTQLREEVGLEAFLAFGCLLGAVRDGRMIGHDCDADVAYLSRHEHPLDVLRENRAAATAMQRLGHQVVRMSDADFKVWLPLPDGRRCGIDVFTGYHHQGLFHLLPSVRGDVRREDLLPVGTVRLEGRDLMAPARPEVLLAATYGPSWRTPDPAFTFRPAPGLLRHMDDYWRGGWRGTWHWTEFHDSAATQVPREPSGFARWVHARLEPAAGLVEVGCGTGRDAAWLAAQGHDVVATDSAHRARTRTAAAHRRAGGAGRLEVRAVNLNDARTTLRAAARLAHDPVPRSVYARLVLDDVDPLARAELRRLARLTTRRGGAAYLEVRDGGGVGPDVLRRELEADGAVVVEDEPGTADGVPPDLTAALPTRRWVVSWPRPTDRGDLR